MISIAKPLIGKEEQLQVQQVLQSGMIASGEKVLEFEKMFAHHFHSPYAVATSSGTTALHASVMALGIQKGDKIITTPFTFAATANSLLFERAIPIFADIDPHTFNIDPNSIEDILQHHSDIKGILIVHLFGMPCNMSRIMDLVNQYHLILIEDCAQSHGAKYNNQYVGSFGKCSTFSFYPTKNMTTGEGGMILTKDPSIYKTIQTIINHGQSKRYIHTSLGHNFRMTNIAASIGIEQLKKLDFFNKKRIDHAQFYHEHIKNPRIVLPPILKNYDSVYHQYTIKTKNPQHFIEHLKKHDIGYGIYYPTPLNAQPYYKSLGYDEKETPIALKISQQVVSIPVHPGLSNKDLYTIVKAINAYE